MPSRIAATAADMPLSYQRFNNYAQGIPDKTARNRPITALLPEIWDRITGAWLGAQARKNAEGEWIIAVDGKVMRGAWTDENDKVTMFSAMLHDEAVTIAQVREI